MKTCKHYKDEIIKLAYNETDLNMQEELMTHLENCSECNKEYLQFKTINEHIKDCRFVPEMNLSAGMLREKLLSNTLAQTRWTWARLSWVAVPALAGLVFLFMFMQNKTNTIIDNSNPIVAETHTETNEKPSIIKDEPEVIIAENTVTEDKVINNKPTSKPKISNKVGLNKKEKTLSKPEEVLVVATLASVENAIDADSEHNFIYIETQRGESSSATEVKVTEYVPIGG